MQNMIKMRKGEKEYSVLFDIDWNTRDFDNINVRDGKHLIAIDETETELIKDLIALEMQFANMELASAYKVGTKPTLV